MNVRRWVSPLVGLAVLSGAGAAAYLTRPAWWPQVFPEKVAKPAGGHGHSHDEDGGHTDDGHEHEHGDSVKLSTQAQQNLKLDVGQPAPQPYWRKLLIPGVVVDRPGESDRGVAARLAGVVEKVHAKPGDTVRGGDALFTLQLVGEGVQTAQRELATAAKELAIATANRDRVAKQVEDKVVAAGSLVEPENQLKRAATQVKGLRRQLQAFGLTPAQIDQAAGGEFVTEVTVAAPGAASASVADTLTAAVYEVQELKVNLGETVQAGQNLCTLSNHQRLFVEGQAFKSEATALAKLAEQRTPIAAEFADETPGEWPDAPPLTVHHLSNVVDPATRTFAFYLPLDNLPRTFDRDGKTHFVWRYRPGQRVRLRVPVEKLGEDVLVLPAGAVVREGAEAYSFVQNGDLFVRKAVRVLHEDRSDVVLANDGSLPGGAFVVRNQAAALNRAIKAAAGGGQEGHSHEH
jgi:cobalt-zinc-cadmium efflux system membrane fusion protein